MNSQNNKTYLNKLFIMEQKNNIYKRLNDAQKICVDGHMDKIYDLIEYNKDLLFNYDLDTIELEELNEFSKIALRTVKNYKLLLDSSLV